MTAIVLLTALLFRIDKVCLGEEFVYIEEYT